MKVILSILCVVILTFSSLWSQSVEIKEKGDKPLADIGGAGGQTRGLSSPRPSAKPDQYTIRYIQINPGPYGSIQGLSSQSVMDQKLGEEFNFPSLSILVSVAARLIPASSYEGVEKIEGSVKSVTELRQMCLNIRLSALYSDKMIISQALKAIDPSLNANNYFVKEFGKEPLDEAARFHHSSGFRLRTESVSAPVIDQP